jgi:predicted RNase H-like HicB family nuclease
MSKPNYRVIVSYDADRKVFSARAPELEHCTAEGATRADAIARVEEEIDAQLANMLSHGSTPPRSVDEEVYSGEVSARVSRLLHRDLAYHARFEGVELDHLVGELLSSALEARRQTRAPRSGNRPPAEQQPPSDNIGNRHDGGPRRQGGFGGRGQYHAVMDDRANFIEYVRGLEQSGGHGPSRGPGGGGGGGDGRRRRRGGHGGPQRHGGHGPNGNGGGRPDRGGHGQRDGAPRMSGMPDGGQSQPGGGDGGGPDRGGNGGGPSGTPA